MGQMIFCKPIKFGTTKGKGLKNRQNIDYTQAELIKDEINYEFNKDLSHRNCAKSFTEPDL